MSIDSIKSKLGLGLNKALLEKNNAAKADEKVANTATTNKVDANNVTLSATSLQLKSLEAETSNEVFDADKVDAIKTAIANGEFKVNAEKVADGLLETVKDLIQTKKT